MSFLTRKSPALGCAVLVAMLMIAAVTLTPIGPIFVYGWLVPIISPILPKPEDVPSRAKAEYHWKGAGLVWVWETRITDGCALFSAAEIFEPTRSLSVYEGGDNCDDGELTIHRLSFEDHTTFGAGPNRWPYEECPFELNAASVKTLLTQIEELKSISSGAIETKMLEDTHTEIKQIDQLGLRAQQFGCRLDRE